VTADALIELMWPGEAPRTAWGTLQGYVSELRRVLEPERMPRGPSSVLVTRDASYRLVLPDRCVDVAVFESDVSEVHGRVAPGSALDGVPSVPVHLSRQELLTLGGRLSRALGLWRGTPYEELGDAPAAAADRARLEELRLVAAEDQALLRLASGERGIVVSDLAPWVRAHPFRESLQAVHIVALAAAERHGDAMAALRRVRKQLADELGADPGPALRRLESAVLRHEALIPPSDARSAPVRARSAERLSELPLVGRSDELRRLTEMLAAADNGRVQLAVLVGEAGIGKSRLVTALCDAAVTRGFVAAIGRCVEDDGAPPLWPWTTLLNDARAQIGAQTDAASRPAYETGGIVSGSLLSAADAAAAQFLARQAMVAELSDLAAQQPVVAVVEDFHWADPSSAQLLRLVADTLYAGRLLVVVTRRPTSPAGDARAAAAEALARRSALRVDLSGLDDASTTALLAAATGTHREPAHVSWLRRRTGGNPFFLLEVARSGAPQDVPPGVGDIVARRVAALPVSTQEVLKVAAAVGEVFELTLVAASAALPDDDTLAALDSAAHAQLIRPGADADVFTFSHALVREAVYAAVAPSRRARLHAAIARVLDDDADRHRLRRSSGAAAWHWLAAGPAWAARAWPAAAAAAQHALALHAYEEAAALLQAAVEAAERDSGCSAEQRFDLLLAWLRACTAIGDRITVHRVARRAVDVAWALNDARRAATAAVASADGAIWALRPYGVVDQEMVDTLERALRELPASDQQLRCQVLLILAAELYYADARQERQALVDEGLAMARRLKDPALVAWASLTAPTAVWTPATARIRHRLAEEAVASARQAGSDTMLTDALVRRAGAALELGQVQDIDDDIAEARHIAERLQLAYPLIAMNMMMIPWRAMQGRLEDAEALSRQVLALAPRARLQPGNAVEVGAVLPLLMWQGRTQEALELFPDVGDPFTEVGRRLLLAQVGRLDELRASWQATGAQDPPDDWFTVFRLCEAASTAAVLSLSTVGAAAYRRLAPHAGTVASAGASGPLGPVDTYLALAARAAGRPVTAARHADDAEGLCRRWGLPLGAQAVRALRTSAGL
jgi:DNA-binding SARP family transcriptional activator